MRFKEILLVDDEIKILNALKRELKGRFGIIHCATSVEEALQLLAENPIELVVSDYHMPGQNGAELVIEIHQKYPYIMTIILSGQADLVGISRALNEGQLYRFIKKPWDTNLLIESMEESFKEAEIRHGRDGMTGMKSLKTLNHYIEQLRQQMNQLPVMVIVDVANMTQINRDYGSSVGNRILCDVAQRLLIYGDVQDFYRYGNKYLFLLPLDRNLYERVQLLNEWIQPPEKFENIIEYHLILHIMDLSIPHPITPEYLATQLQSFSSSFEGSESLCIVCVDPSQSDIYQLFSIQQGLKNGEFLAFYQPQWNVTTAKLEGVEALARWQDQAENLCSPADFLPILDKYNIMDLFTEKILQVVVQFIQENEIQLHHIHISINVPGRMLIDGQFYDLLVQYTHLEPTIISKLSVEITEQDLIENFTQAKKELEKLKVLGISCALDDFGTGYSGYEYLFEMPFDALKIDGRFVQSIGEHEATSVVLQSMITSAQTLHMTVIAEWVETQAQVDLLQALGCSIIQGHFVGEALSPKELLNFIAE